jgi:hypothetical protein
VSGARMHAAYIRPGGVNQVYVCMIMWWASVWSENALPSYEFSVFTMLPNLRKSVYLICVLSNINISQPICGFSYILVTVYVTPLILIK